MSKLQRAVYDRPYNILLLLLLFSACGRVGPPQPPFIRIPEAVTDLTVTQRGYDLVLAWTNPPRYIDGSAATNLSRVQIQANGSALAAVDVIKAGAPQSYVTPVGSTTNGERKFAVIVETWQGRLSAISNLASIIPVDVPGPVIRLTATADQRRIWLRWEQPLDQAELADAYIVSRVDIPAEAETVTDTRFEDIRYPAGKAVTYHVTAIRRVAGGLVMGAGPVSVTVTAFDKTPPLAPTRIGITQSALTWEANSETDLAGYRVFRSERPDSGFTEVSDRILTTNIFFDPSYRPGLYYAVSAVDESDNESPRSAPLRSP